MTNRLGYSLLIAFVVMGQLNQSWPGVFEALARKGLGSGVMTSVVLGSYVLGLLISLFIWAVFWRKQ